MFQNKIDDVITFIQRNSEKIIEQITQEDIDIYCLIQEQFKNSRGNIEANTLFKFRKQTQSRIRIYP